MNQAPPLKPIPQLSAPPLIGSFLDFKNRRLETLLRVNKECGDVGAIKIGPVRLVLVSSPELTEAMLLKESQKVGRGMFYKMVLPFTGANSVFAKEGDAHRKHRMLYSPLFQHKRLVNYMNWMTEFADQYQQGIQNGTPLDMEQEMMRLAQRVIEKTLFNRDGDKDPGEIFDAMRVASAYFVHLFTTFMITPLSWPTPRNNEARRAIAVLRRRSKDLIDAWHAEGGVDRGDLLSLLMVARHEDGASLTNEELIDHVLTLYNAGHETTATAFMWIFYLLSQHPEVEAKLHQEVDTVLNGRKPEYADLARMPYTLQVVKECLRFRPPAYVYGRAPREDIDIAGYRLPKGQFILISPYVLHNNAKYFPEPERFDPERFTPENEKKLPRCAFLPFGIGPMVCVGQQFAMMELHCMVAHIAQFLRFRVAPGENVKAIPQLTLRPSSLRMVAERRGAGGQRQAAPSANVGT